MENKCDEKDKCAMELEEQLNALRSASESSAGCTAAKLLDAKNQVRMELQDKFDRLERDNEKLTKDMLKHMRRADELNDAMKAVRNNFIVCADSLIIMLILSLYFRFS